MNAQTIAVEFADALSRQRALTDQETDRLCEVLSCRQQRVHRLWTAKDDRQLMQLFRKRYNAVQIASIVGRTPGAVRFRKSLLKARTIVSGDETCPS